MEVQWCDISKIILIVFAFIFFMTLCAKWNKDYEEEFKIFPYSDKEFICSKNCCGSYWKDGLIVNDGVDPEKYQASNLNCSDGAKDVGCICVPKSDS
jgi:hypothetical protein